MQQSFLPGRREFLKHSGSCSAWLLAMTTFAPTAVRRVFEQPQENERLFEKKWGWIEKLGDNVWTHIAAPFENQDFTTVCNGGFVAGTDRVLAIESFMQPKGARWLAERCKELTGRWPTDIVVTHFHPDHVAGSSGYEAEGESPTMWLTETTLDLVRKTGETQGQPPTLPDNLKSISETEKTELDLGDRVVTLNPAAGHTPSDVTIEVADPKVVFTGDLFFNRMVPNFRDATPKQLNESVSALVRDDETQYVPGHGTMAGVDDLKRFQEFLGVMEQAARTAHAAGKTADEAADEYKLSGKFAEWYVFSDQVIPRVFAAWYQDIGNEKQ